jgi:hypothetical protein
MLKRPLFFVVAIIFSSVQATAQNWKSDIEKACVVFSAQNVEIEVEHLFYSSTEATVPIERQTIWMQKMGDCYHIKQYGTEVIRNSRYTAFVNEQAKVVGIGDTKIKQTTPSQGDSSEMVQNMVKIITEYLSRLKIDSTQNKEAYAVHYLGIANGTKKYRFDYNSGKFLQSTVYLSAKTGLLAKVSCILREPLEVEPGVFRKVRVEMVYRKQETGKKFTESMFSTDSIVKVNSQGEAILADEYTQYRLLNNITK